MAKSFKRPLDSEMETLKETRPKAPKFQIHVKILEKDNYYLETKPKWPRLDKTRLLQMYIYLSSLMHAKLLQIQF